METINTTAIELMGAIYASPELNSGYYRPRISHLLGYSGDTVPEQYSSEFMDLVELALNQGLLLKTVRTDITATVCGDATTEKTDVRVSYVPTDEGRQAVAETRAFALSDEAVWVVCDHGASKSKHWCHEGSGAFASRTGMPRALAASAYQELVAAEYFSRDGSYYRNGPAYELIRALVKQ
jgi:hypothetical protein